MGIPDLMDHPSTQSTGFPHNYFRECPYNGIACKSIAEIRFQLPESPSDIVDLMKSIEHWDWVDGVLGPSPGRDQLTFPVRWLYVLNPQNRFEIGNMPDPLGKEYLPHRVEFNQLGLSQNRGAQLKSLSLIEQFVKKYYTGWVEFHVGGAHLENYEIPHNPHGSPGRFLFSYPIKEIVLTYDHRVAAGEWMYMSRKVDEWQARGLKVTSYFETELGVTIDKSERPRVNP